MLKTSWQAHFDGNPITGPVLNGMTLHPSGSTFITTGTDGRTCMWDLNTYTLLRSIKALENSIISDTIAWYGKILVVGGKDGGGDENICGDFTRLLTWDLSQLTLPPGTNEVFRQLGGNYQFTRRVWSFESHLVIIVLDKGKLALEVWSDTSKTP